MESGPDSGEEAPVPFGTFRPSERRALIGCAFAAMCILLMPQELAGAAICLLLTIGLFVWHRRKSNREQAAATAALNVAAAAALAAAATQDSAPDASPPAMPAAGGEADPAPREEAL